MSTTPRTDAAAFWARPAGDDSNPPNEQVVSLADARELEQELEQNKANNLKLSRMIEVLHAEEVAKLEQENAAQKRWMESAAENLPLLQAEVAQQAEEIKRLLEALEQVADPDPMVSPTELASKRRRIAEAALAPNATGKHP